MTNDTQTIDQLRCTLCNNMLYEFQVFDDRLKTYAVKAYTMVSIKPTTDEGQYHLRIYDEPADTYHLLYLTIDDLHTIARGDAVAGFATSRKVIQQQVDAFTKDLTQ